MAGTVTHGSSLGSTSNTTSYNSNAFTPAVGDVIVVCVVATGTNGGTAGGTVTASANGISTFTLAYQATKGGGADVIQVFVSDQKATGTASMTVNYSCAGDSATGCYIVVERVAGITRSDPPSAVRSVGAVNDATAGTPTVALSNAYDNNALTTSVLIGVVGTASNTTTNTSPPTGWTERADAGYNTPTTGIEVATVNSGFTGNTVTWGAAPSTPYGAVVIELDTTNGTTTIPLGLVTGSNTAQPFYSTTTPATLAGYYDSGDFLATGTPKSVTGVAWQAGDKIVVFGLTEDSGFTFNTPTNANLTFALEKSDGSATRLYIWSATAASSQTGQTIQASLNSGSGSSGLAVFVLRGHGGIVVPTMVATTAKGMSYTRTSDNSLILYGDADWSAAAATTNWTPSTPAHVRQNFGDGSNYGGMVLDWGDQGSAGTSTYGETGTGSQTIVKGVVEVLPFRDYNQYVAPQIVTLGIASEEDHTYQGPNGLDGAVVSPYNRSYGDTYYATSTVSNLYWEDFGYRWWPDDRLYVALHPFNTGIKVWDNNHYGSGHTPLPESSPELYVEIGDLNFTVAGLTVNLSHEFQDDPSTFDGAEYTKVEIMRGTTVIKTGYLRPAGGAGSDISFPYTLTSGERAAFNEASGAARMRFTYDEPHAYNHSYLYALSMEVSPGIVQVLGIATETDGFGPTAPILAVSGNNVAPATVYADDFSGGTLNSSLWAPDLPEMVDVSGGQLALLQTDDGNIFSVVGGEVDLLAGPHFFQIVSVDSSVDGTQFGITEAYGGLLYAEIIGNRFRIKAVGWRGVTQTLYDGGAGSWPGNTGDGTYRWVRFSNNGTNVLIETSSDAASWTLRATVEQARNITPVFQVSSSAASGTTLAVLDNVDTTPAITVTLGLVSESNQVIGLGVHTMPSVVHLTDLADTTDAASYTTGSFTPSEGQQLLVFVIRHSSTGDTTVTADANGLTFSLVDGGFDGLGRGYYTFIADQKVGSSPVAMTLTVDTSGDAATGMAVSVDAVSGLPQAGLAAVRQATHNNGLSTEAPNFTFSQATVIGNPLMTFLNNTTNPPGVTPPAGFTELTAVGFSSPTVGLETAYQADPTDSVTTVTFGATTSTWRGNALELEARAVTAVGQATETDDVLALAAARSITLGQLVEADAALGVTRGATVVVLGLVSETDEAQPGVRQKALALGLAAETDQTLVSADTIWDHGSVSGPTGPATDSADVTLGTVFQAGADGLLTHIHHWTPTANWPTEAGLWDDSGTLIASWSPTWDHAGTEDTWQTYALPSPVSLTAGAWYVVGVFWGSYNNDYPATGAYFTSDVDSGALHVPDSTEAAGQGFAGNGLYGYNAGAMVFPTSTFNSSNYWVDVTVATRALTPVSVRGLGLASETDDSPGLARGSRTIALGLVAETDTPQALTVVDPDLVVLGQAGETDAVLGLTAVSITVLGLATETDTAQQMGVVDPILTTLGQVSETDVAQPTGRRKVIALGLVSEVDAALSLTAVDSILVVLGQPSEADAVLTLGTRKTKALGIASETDSPLALAAVDPILRTLGQPSEADAVLGLTARKTRALGLVAETDSALAITKVDPIQVTLGVAVEVDEAFNLGTSIARGIGLLLETDEVLAATARKTVALGLSNEGDAGQPVTSRKTVTLGLVSETDATSALTARKTATLGLATGAGAGLGLLGLHRKAVGLATETDAVLATTTRKVAGLGVATETGSSLGLALPGKTYLALGQLTETDSTAALAHTKTKALGLTSEPDAALALTTVRRAALGRPTETDTTAALAARKVVVLGQVTESDSSLGVSPPGKIYRPLGLVSDAENSHPLTPRKTKAIGLVTEPDAALTIGVAHQGSLGLPGDTGAVTALARTTRKTLGLVAESDSTPGLVTGTELGQPSDIGTAQGLGRTKRITLGQLVELEQAEALVALKQRTLGWNEEVDRTFSVFNPNSRRNVYFEASRPHGHELRVRVAEPRKMGVTVHGHQITFTLEDDG